MYQYYDQECIHYIALIIFAKYLCQNLHLLSKKMTENNQNATFTAIGLHSIFHFKPSYIFLINIKKQGDWLICLLIKNPANSQHQLQASYLTSIILTDMQPSCQTIACCIFCDWMHSFIISNMLNIVAAYEVLTFFFVHP